MEMIDKFFKLEDLELILNKTSRSIYVHDKEGNLLYANPHAIKQYGCNDFEELKQLGLFHESPYSKKEALEKILAAYTEEQKFEWKAIRKDGSIFWEEIELKKMTLNGIERIVAFSYDITERKNMQEELEEKNEYFNQMMRIIGHDLKSPFQGIMGFLNLLSDQYFDFDDSVKIDMIRMAQGSSNTVLNLLENLLEFGRSNSGQISYNPTDLNLRGIVNNVYDLNSISLKKKDITFKNDVDNNFKIYADNHMLNTILRNLVSNSIKFTKDKGTITVDAYNTNDYYQIDITDTGKGMNGYDKKRLFKEHFTTYGTNNEKGSGIGLQLVKNYIGIHNGKINVMSEIDKGTTFQLYFPKRLD
jgi:PAS domain S-box-containing protein